MIDNFYTRTMVQKQGIDAKKSLRSEWRLKEQLGVNKMGNNQPSEKG